VRLKKLHKLLLSSFIPPFFATLFVSVFLFFLVQIVITYLDDMIGKGLRTIDLLQLFAYAWTAIIPQCIPLAVLLASIMCFGNLAENYELAAMKSSGLSLFRIMKPLIYLILVLAFLTFLFNNFILPTVHLKSSALLYDIRQKKPSVNIKEGIFYNKIDNYAIRVGHKSKNKDTLKDIIIYDHSGNNGNTIQVYAHSAKMSMNADTSSLVLMLKNGNRYENVPNQNNPARAKSLSILSFKNLQVNIDLGDFKMKRTDEKLFKGHEEMMNIWQIDSVADSTRRKVNRLTENLYTQVKEYFYIRSNTLLKDTLRYTSASIDSVLKKCNKENKIKAYDYALNITRNNIGSMENAGNNRLSEEYQLLALEIEWHKKIVVSFACIILFFIGAPLGAIIRKGGLGLPVVTAVFFFLAYYILSEAFFAVAIEGSMIPWQAMWAPLAIFLPISIFLTYKAANDSALFDATSYYILFEKLVKRKKG
jgi:lipopolysaccharide export system permease protein